MVARTVKNSVGISFDVLVKVNNFIFFVNYDILNYEVEFEMPITLEWLILATSRALVDMKNGNLKFKLNNEEVTFNVCRTMK